MGKDTKIKQNTDEKERKITLFNILLLPLPSNQIVKNTTMEKRAIVIGASSGIGREVAKLLMEQGWTVGVAARRVDKLHELQSAEVEQIDVTQEEATTKLQAQIGRAHV